MRAPSGRGRLPLPALAAGALAAVLAAAAGSSASPRFVLVFRLAPPRASATRAIALARSLGLDNPTVRETPSSYVVGERGGERRLVLYRASGGFDYVDGSAYRQPPAGPLPTKPEASRLAIDFLRRHNLLPAEDVRIAVRPDSRSGPTAEVVALTPLAAGAPVLDGAITFWLGAGGSLERLRDEHRSLTTTAIRVTARPRAAVLKEIREDVGASRRVRLRFAYVAQPSYLPQPYLDPVYEAVAGGAVVDRVRATTFTPRVTIVAPDPSAPLVAGSNVHLRARGQDGRRPYRFRWYADASGFLGSGKSIYAPLRANDTEIRLTIRDSSGASTTVVQPVVVAGSWPETRAAPASGYGDGTISFDARQDAAHPLAFSDVVAGGVPGASAVYFDQFRYSVRVRFLGSDYHITSGKCVPLTAPGDACALPKGPYAESAGASAPAASARGSRVDSALTLANLPGRLKLLTEGSAGPAYCGPRGELGAIALELLPKFVFGAATTLGGDCPGFRASADWSYSPPTAFRPSEFAKLCLQSPTVCDVPQAQLAQWVTGALDNGTQPEIVDFRLSVYTAIVPSAGPARAALAKEGNRLLMPAATDGPPDPSCAAPFVCISPIATERAAVLAGPGDWDELYLKSEGPEPRGIAYPRCNRPARDDQDVPTCIHLRDRSRGQEAAVFVVRGRAGEASPASVESLADDEALRRDTDHGYDVVLWHRSTASSTECYPSGGVDNTDRPCRVLPTPLFFTPR